MFFRILLAAALMLAPGLAAAADEPAPRTAVTWHGHSAFEIVTPDGTVLFIDPWLNNPKNPNAGKDADPVAGVQRADYLLITHAHFDHVGDAVALAQKTGAQLVTNYELGTNMARVLGYPEDHMGFDTLMNIGGEIELADGEVRVRMTPAIHSSGLKRPDADEGEPALVYGGHAAGFVIAISDGPTIYHSGDTAYFSDMSRIGKRRPDLALLNIGGHFNMTPEAAVEAATDVRARWVVPHHYGTFPVLTEDAFHFEEMIDALEGIGVRPLEPGETITFEENTLLAK